MGRPNLGLCFVTLVVTAACSAPDDSSDPNPMMSGGSAAVGGAGGAVGKGGGASAGGAAAGGSSTGGTAAGGAGSGGVGTGGTGPGTGGSGNSSTGGSDGGSASGGTGNQPPVNVLPCDALTTVGQWEDITPPGVTFTQDFVVDPINSGTVYVGGGQGFGIWKSTNCGSEWSKVNTGQNAAAIDGGGHWTLAIDHTDPNVLYTANGYGENGIFKTTNGGQDWAQVVSADKLSAFIYGGFVERITIDPTDHQHVLVSPHFDCQNGHTHCFLETKDAGATWTVLDDQPPVTEDSGQVMISSTLWFYANTWGEGLYRTSDAGGSWQIVHGYGATDSIYIADDGTYFDTSLSEGVLKSTDLGLSWTVLPDSPHVRAIVGNGTTLFTSNRNENPPYKPYGFASESNPTTWSTYDSPDLPRGGWVLHYDRGHDVLYSSTESNGFWRVKTK